MTRTSVGGVPDRYDPFERGRFPVGVVTMHVKDPARDQVFPCEIWYPAAARYAGEDVSPRTQDRFTAQGAQRRQAAVRDADALPGSYPLVVFSHNSGGHRRVSSYLCTHLASHGYLVAALDHSEVVTPELAPGAGLTVAQRVAAWIANRVPDIRFLLDSVLGGPWRSAAMPDPDRIGIVGYTPLAGMYELFDRTPASATMVILRRADHLHFVDDVERTHEAVRGMTFAGETAWIPAAVPPIRELCSGERAHLFVRGLALCHLDAVLRGLEPARRLHTGDIESELGARGVEALLHGR